MSDVTLEVSAGSWGGQDQGSPSTAGECLFRGSAGLSCLSLGEDFGHCWSIVLQSAGASAPPPPPHPVWLSKVATGFLLTPALQMSICYSWRAQRLPYLFSGLSRGNSVGLTNVAR